MDLEIGGIDALVVDLLVANDNIRRSGTPSESWRKALPRNRMDLDSERTTKPLPIRYGSNSSR